MPRIIIITLALMLVFANCTTAFATDEANQTVNGPVTVCDLSNPSATSITPYGDLGYYTTKTLYSTTYKKMIFARYESSNWIQTDHYTIAAGKDYNFSFSYTYEGAGLSISFSQSFGNTATIC